MKLTQDDLLFQYCFVITITMDLRVVYALACSYVDGRVSRRLVSGLVNFEGSFYPLLKLQKKLRMHGVGLVEDLKKGPCARTPTLCRRSRRIRMEPGLELGFYHLRDGPLGPNSFRRVLSGVGASESLDGAGAPVAG